MSDFSEIKEELRSFVDGWADRHNLSLQMTGYLVFDLTRHLSEQFLHNARLYDGTLEYKDEKERLEIHPSPAQRES